LAVPLSGQVWFGYLSGGAVGVLDPSTGAVHLHQLASNQAAVYSMNVDARGIVWFTEIEGGKLGRIDALTGGS
jgi:virginiamycin B lyase